MRTLATLTSLAVLFVGCSAKTESAPSENGTRTHEQKAVTEIVRLDGTVITWGEREETHIDANGKTITIKKKMTLKEVDLDSTAVSDASLIHLQQITNLYGVRLNRTGIGDRGLIHLRKMTKLKRLGLRGTKVTDAGLVHLKGLTNLEWLGLEETAVTSAGVKKLQALLPKCNISH